jgi:hypothetical protein
VVLVTIFFVLIISNIAAFLPTQISLIVSILSEGLGQPLGPYILVIILSGFYIFKVLNSFTDFLVFMIMSEDIRKEVKALFCMLHVYSINIYCITTSIRIKIYITQ